MGCPSRVVLGANLVFAITTHDVDTGTLTDASSAPIYRVYEDETATAILTGTMSTLDTANTTGFYSELIACTTGNGFEVNKNYSVYIEATVDGITGGITYAFNVESSVQTEVDAAIDTAIAELAQGAPTATPTIRTALMLLYMAFRNERTSTNTLLNVKDDSGVIISKATLSDDGTTFTKAEFISGA